MVAWLLLLAQDSGAMLDRAKAMLSAEQHCTVQDTTDVTVCGLRRADRYRVPIVVHDPGDPAHEGVPAERERLLARSNPVKDLSPFLVGGGMAGVKATVNASGTHADTLRPLAP